MTDSTINTIAPISRRAVAYLIDALIAGALAIVGFVIIGFAAMGAGSVEAAIAVFSIGYCIVMLVLVGWLVVYTFMQSKAGSIGMRAQGIRLASEGAGDPVGFGRALLRNVVFGASCAIVVGYFTPLFDNSGRFQGWHDRVAKALMLDARTSLLPAAAPMAQAPASTLATPTTPPVRGATSIPGLPPLPGVPPLPPLPVTPPVPVAPAAPEAPAAPAVPATPATQATTPGPAARVDDATLIAFVPGVTQPAPPQRQADSATSGLDPSLDETVVQDRTPQPAPDEFDESDDAELENTRISIPGHGLVFTWDDGARVTVTRRTIFGRNPAPEDGAVLVSVRDETLSLSKTHFEAAADVAGGWVLDRHSTNGLTIVRDGQRIACPAGQRVPIRLGDTIEIGDRLVTVGGYV